jgi:hypothetical protein
VSYTLSNKIRYLQFLSKDNNAGAVLASGVASNLNEMATIFYPVNSSHAVLGLTGKRWDLFATNIDTTYLEAGSIYSKGIYENGARVAT